MTTITIPLNKELEETVESLLQDGRFDTKTSMVRYALQRLAEEEAVERVLRAEREIQEGKGLSGDVRALVDNI